ncbi:MAG: hypothetical protein IJ879_09380, partial [Muribaculaceae bacterium]|nr:hypothetical protein [Muribaculaceae bacterium]
MKKTFLKPILLLAALMLVAENGVPDVVVMRNLNVSQQNAVFKFRRVSYHAPFAYIHVAAYVRAGAYFSIAPYNRGRDNRRRLVYSDVFADQNA